MQETHTLQGELIVGNMVHGAALNCMVIPYDNPEDWFFQQFVSQEAAETFAMEHKLVIKRKEDEQRT
jgi:hypothetical protein